MMEDQSILSSDGIRSTTQDVRALEEKVAYLYNGNNSIIIIIVMILIIIIIMKTIIIGMIIESMFRNHAVSIRICLIFKVIFLHKFTWMRKFGRSIDDFLII